MMKNIDEDIKRGQFAQVYLLYGEEAYLKKQYKDKLKHAMVPEGDTMNFSAFEGKSINPKEIIDLAETLPFFADFSKMPAKSWQNISRRWHRQPILFLWRMRSTSVLKCIRRRRRLEGS